jgi:putative ABC transport system substrate-binding protein
MTGAALLGLLGNLRAQSPAATPRIGFLSAFAPADIDVFLGLIRQELEKLGWTDGRNIVLLEPRTTGGDNARLPLVAGELVAQDPDVILVQTVPATRALMQATKSIPIVMLAVGNPVDLGIVADFRRPGGNITGTSYLSNEFSVKLLQFLKEAVPRVRSVAVFVNPTNEHGAQYSKKMTAEAATLGMRAQIVHVSSQVDLETAFAAIHSANTQSILLPAEPLIMSKRDAIASFAQTRGLPLVVQGTGRVLPASGLMAFAPAREEYARLAVRYVDRILKGAKPGELAIEQPMRFSLVINLKAAKSLGLTIPQALLQRAEEVIQ